MRFRIDKLEKENLWTLKDNSTHSVVFFDSIKMTDGKAFQFYRNNFLVYYLATRELPGYIFERLTELEAEI